MNWPSPLAASALLASGGVEATHVQLADAAVPLPPPPPPHCAVRRSLVISSDGTAQPEFACAGPPPPPPLPLLQPPLPPRTKIPVWEETPYRAPVSDAFASGMVRLHRGDSVTTKVELVELNERIGYGAAAAAAAVVLLPTGRSGVEAVAPQAARRMGQSPEKPKG
jgi:hypothetical protein